MKTLRVIVVLLMSFSLGFSHLRGLSDEKTIPNIEQMQLGIIHASMNPDQGTVDPGYTRKLFDFTYSEDDPCKNGDFLVPDALCTSFQKRMSTSVLNTVDYIYSYQDYQLALWRQNTFDMSVSIGTSTTDLLEATAELSSEFQVTTEFMEQQESVVITSRAYTESYFAEMSKHIVDMRMIKLNKELVMDFVDLPLTYEGNERIYVDFVMYWGTHYQWSVVAGAKYAIKSMFEIGEYYAMVAEGMDVTATASESTWTGATKSKEGAGSESAEVTEYNKRAAGAQTTIAYGPEPPTANPSDWWAVAFDNPASLFTVMKPIYEILTPELTEDPNASAKQVNILLAMGDICKYENCFEPTPPDPILWETVSITGAVTKQLSLANDTLCYLSWVGKTTFESCKVYLGQVAGDTNYYWFLRGSGESVSCSATCSKKGLVSWANIINKPVRSYQKTVEYNHDGTYTYALNAETPDKAFCYPALVQNHVGCYDYCKVTVDNGAYAIHLYTADPWDDKHAYLNSANRVCGALCFDVKTTPKLLLSKEIVPGNGLVTLTRANETICVPSMFKGTGACDSNSGGGSCGVKVQEVPGQEGDFFAAQAFVGNDNDFDCNGDCMVNCYAL